MSASCSRSTRTRSVRTRVAARGTTWQSAAAVLADRCGRQSHSPRKRALLRAIGRGRRWMVASAAHARLRTRRRRALRVKYIVEAGAGQLAPPAVAVVDIADLALQPDTDRDINPDRELFLFDNAMDVARKVGLSSRPCRAPAVTMPVFIRMHLFMCACVRACTPVHTGEEGLLRAGQRAQVPAAHAPQRARPRAGAVRSVRSSPVDELFAPFPSARRRSRARDCGTP